MKYQSKHWQLIKQSKPLLTAHLKEIAIAMVITDATMYRISSEALMKVEQGYKQLAFVQHLWDLFSDYCWGTLYNTRMDTSAASPRLGQVKSYWFKTFSHKAFTEVYNICYLNGKKCIQEGIIQNHITGLGLAYMIMADGSLWSSNDVILNLQGFTKEENTIISNELNLKFGLHSIVIPHKVKYWVVKIPAKDASTVKQLIAPHMLSMFDYKVPTI